MISMMVCQTIGLGTVNPMGTRSVEPESQAIWRLGDAEQGVMLSGGLQTVPKSILFGPAKSKRKVLIPKNCLA